MVDCWLDRVLHRRLSRPVSLAAGRLGVSPNLVTLGSLATGLAAAACLTAEGVLVWSLAVPLYVVAVVLDHADGEVARLTGRTSSFGHWLDLAVDTVVHLTLVLAMGSVAERVGFWAGNELGASAAVGVVLSAGTAGAWPFGDASRGSRVGVGRVLDGLANRQGFYGILLVFMLCRALAQGLLPTLMVVVAVGSNAYWIGRVAVAIAFRPRPDSQHSPEARAAGRSRGDPPVTGRPRREDMALRNRARDWLVRVLVVGLVVTGSLAQAKGSGGGAGGAPPKLPEPLTKEAIRELVARLDDDQVRQLLLQQLDRAAVATAPKQTGSDPMAMATDMAARSQRLAELAAGVRALPGELLDARGRFLEGRGTGHFLLVAVLFAVMLAVGFLVERLFGWATRRLRQSIPGQRDGFAGQVSRFILGLVLDLLDLVGFVVGALGFFFALYQGHAPSRQLVLTYLAAVVIVRLVALLSRSVLAPGRPEQRLVPLGDGAASRLHRGLVWLAGIYGFGIGTIQLLRTLGVADDTLDGLGLLVGVLFLALAIETVWGIRADVARLIRGPGEPGPLRRLLAEVWPLLASVYLLVVFVSRVTEVLSGQSGQSKAPILSVVLLVALPLVDMILGRMLKGWFTRAPEPEASPAGASSAGVAGAAEPAGSAPRAGMTFEPVLHRALHIVIMVGGLLILADLWDLDLFDLAERGMGARISSALLGIGITLLLAWTMWELAQTFINRQMAREGGAVAAEAGEEGSDRPATRLRTLLPLIRALILTTIVVMTALSILSALGVNILPLLAGAGVFGLAIGFGSQTLVRDVVSGAFFLMDDAFRLGEYIEAGDSKGTVEKIGIRSLQVRHHRGALNIVPYGEIKRLRNTSRDWMIMTLEFRVPYETDLLKVKKIIKRIGEDLMKDPELGPDLLQPLKSQGVMATDDAGLLIRAKFMSKPTSTPYLVRREAYNRILKAFAAEGIRFASRQVTVLSTGAGGAVAVAGAATTAIPAPPVES